MNGKLIDDLGGNKVVADALGTTPGAVANWRLAGREIPWKRRHAIARLAADKGVPLPETFWSEDVA